MKRILRGTVLLALTAVFGACSSESGPTQDGTADHIVAEPSVVFIGRADSQAVRIRLVDQQGTSLREPITISGFATGINVRADSGFQPIYTTGDSLVFNTNATELRVWVSTNALASSQFSISAGGKTLDVPVIVTPGTAESFAFSPLAPALGDVVTVTVPTDLLFTDSTALVFGGTTVTPNSVATDGSSLTFNAGPGLLGPAKLTNVTLTYNTKVVFTVPAADTLNSPPVTQAFTYTNLSPALGEAVTITPPAGVVFTSGTVATFDSAGPAPHYTIAPDGSSMSLVAGPNSVGGNTFTNMANPANPTFLFTLKSTDTLVSPRVDTFLVNTDKTTAAANEAVTITGATSAFKFSPTTSFVAGVDPTFVPVYITSISADSSTAVVLPQPGANGRFFETGGLVSGFGLNLPTDKSITVGAMTPQAGTDAFATAPLLATPAAGSTVALWDGSTTGAAGYGHDSCDFFGAGPGCGADARLYKFVVPASQTFTFALPYIADGADLGVYFYDAAFTPLSSAVDANGGSPNAEKGNVTLAAGTYYIAIVWFDYTTASSQYLLAITGQ